jgi:hypothetical protein
MPVCCSGRLGKVTLGGGNKSGLFQVLNTDYSPQVAAECMNRLAKLRCVSSARSCENSEGWPHSLADGCNRDAMPGGRQDHKGTPGCVASHRVGTKWSLLTCVCVHRTCPQTAHKPRTLTSAPTPPSWSPCSARFIGDRGFSIGIDDVTPKQRLQDEKARTLETG